MNRLFVMALGFWMLGLVLGTASDSYPRTTATFRGGYRVLQADLHVHTRFSDGFLSPFEIPWVARRHGLDVVAVTEHNLVFPAKMTAWFSRLVDGPAVLIGQELTTRDYHVTAVGLHDTVHWNQALSQALEQIHEQGGVAIAAHPVRRFWAVFDRVHRQLDGVEIAHPSILLPPRTGWRGADMLDYYKRLRADGHEVAAIGTSDYHFFKTMGRFRTLIFASSAKPQDILSALRKKRTVVYFDDGTAYGASTLKDLIRRDPVPRYEATSSYRANGMTDSIARTAGWLGLLGLVLVSRRPVRR